ncbi:MAG: epidermal growth factor receptor substrate 15 [Alphaproteobacteria bacterium]|jgi:epidermal growth factor receptor substrate 15
MKLTFVAKLFIPFMTLSMLLNSAKAFALGQYIQKQSVAQINTILYLGAGVIGALIAIVFVHRFLKNRRISQYEDAQIFNDSLLDNLPIGILHVNLDGKVIYANTESTKLLGRLNEALLNQYLFECFESEHAPDIESAMRENDSQITAKARASNLFLSVKFGDVNGDEEQQYKIVCLADENQVQRKLKVASSELTKHQKMTGALALHNIWIDVVEDTYSYDNGFADLLLLCHDNNSKEKQEAGNTPRKPSAKELTERIHHADSSAWSTALQNAKTKGQTELLCRMQLNTNGENKVYIAVRISIVATLNENDECTKLHIGVLDNSQADTAKQLLDIKTQEQQAILNASTHPIYALDESGNILWSNSAFNMLFRHFASDTKSKNLFEIDFFPDDIKKLHQSSTGLSGRSYEAAFSLTDPHGDANIAQHFKMTLAFYSTKNRLGEKSIKGMLGILNDITEIQTAKDAVQQQQKQLDSMLNLAPVAIATIDAEDRIISANSVMSRRLGFSDSELKKQDFYQLFNEPTAAGKAAKKLHQTGHLRDFHAQLKGKDSKLHPSELHVDIINKEKQEYLCWIADRSDEQFQQDKFDSLLEHSSMPMAILGENGFSKLNVEACKFFCVENDFDLFGVSPFSMRLNTNEDTAKALQQIVDEVKASGKAKAFTWEHQVGDLILPCQATYVPLYKDQIFDSILCIWMDKRELQKADEARQLATNLHQAAERQVAEKQELLASSQDQLATKMRTLADTEHKLQTAQDDLNETQSEYQYLQQEHKNVTDNLLQLKSEYSESRELLADAQQVNTNLNAQLESSSEEVRGLNAQRSEIADALKQSEENYKAAQEQLAISEENTEALTEQQGAQNQKMHALVEQITNMKQSVTDKDAQINQVSEQINELQTQLTSSSSTTEKLREQLVSQREASEKAELERREIEETCQIAQAELRNKVRHLSHLQSEMEKLEEMSSQEKGDMQAQQSALKEELDDKLAQLQNTQTALEAAQQAAEHEKIEKASQQELLAKVQKELLEVEQAAQQKQEELAQKEKEQRLAQQQLQQKLWSELKAKQQKLQETEQVLHQAKQQTESEKAEKDKHRQLFEKLQTELQDIEKRNEAQQAKMAQSDEQWNKSKDALKQEVEAKRDQLVQTKQALDEIQQQADKERLARIEQEQKLEQLAVELSDVETRANKQKEMLAGSDEQWRKHHDEIEQQKEQLQQALQSAQQQNENLQSKLSNKLDDLQAAESQVSETQSGEKAVQKDLEMARVQAEELQSKISHQEEKEVALQHQLTSQQQALESKESSITDLQDKQKALTEELAAVQQEYAQSKETLSVQHDSHSDLSSQMNHLEGALEQSEQQLADKESALQNAQKALQESQAKLAEQEDALLTAHKQELQVANEQASSSDRDTRKPDIAKLPMPPKPSVWFDLLPYLQRQPNIESLPIALTQLMNDLESTIKSTESALEHNDTRQLLRSSKELVSLSQKINSDALGYLMVSIQNDCTNGMVDNVSIRWPATKQGLQKTLRVVYSHLHA